jgi:hypothetical protein
MFVILRKTEQISSKHIRFDVEGFRFTCRPIVHGATRAHHDSGLWEFCVVEHMAASDHPDTNGLRVFVNQQPTFSCIFFVSRSATQPQYILSTTLVSQVFQTLFAMANGRHVVLN